MKALKILTVTIIALLAIAFIVPVFMSDEAVATSSIEINSDEIIVFRQVNDLKNWKNWSPFEEDSTIVNSYEGPEIGIGSTRIWTGEVAGDGKMTILESKPYSHIKNKLLFGTESSGVGTWEFTENNGIVKVNWTITVSELSYPFEKLFGPVIESMTSKMLKNGLKSLKQYSEKQLSPPKIEIVETSLITSLAIYDSTKIENMAIFFEEKYGKIMKYITAKGYAISGAPFAVYHNWDPDGYIKISAAIPVQGNIKGNKEIKKLEIESGKAIFLKHFGGYNTANSHYAIDEYIKEHNLFTKSFIWESYVSDPEMELDSTKWQTDIYYPLK
jgi:effector-binding domain-containing protein/ribosome-associated toxin RatA of RatAB toxin-antitoxin module